MGNKLPRPDGKPGSAIEAAPGGGKPFVPGPLGAVTGAGGSLPTTPKGLSPTDTDDDAGETGDVTFEDVEILRRYSHVQDRPVGIEDFDLLKVLGKGSFGKVMLVRFKGSQELYAMKTLRKEALIRRNQLAHTSTERYILQNIHHPFLMHLAFAFQTRDKLYMVVEFMAGGELFFWLKKGKFTENRAKLYAAEIACALECLHDHNIVYRDLKPENILLDGDGHIRITDFGLSKDNVTGYGAEGGTTTFCGTPEYLAPEVLENKGHGKGIDWWSLGTLLYEMICGLPPYYDQNVQKMYKKIMTAPLNPPKILSDDAKALVRGLLERRVANRLGCGPTGAQEIKKHPFFSCYDWTKVLEKEYKAEFVPPRRRKSLDVDNFDKEFTAEPAIDSVVQNHLSEQQEELTKFEGFTYEGQSHMT